MSDISFYWPDSITNKQGFEKDLKNGIKTEEDWGAHQYKLVGSCVHMYGFFQKKSSTFKDT